MHAVGDPQNLPEQGSDLSEALYYGGLTLACCGLFMWMSPTFAMWIILACRAAAIFAANGLAQFIAFIQAPVQNMRIVVGTTAMLLKVSLVNAFYAASAINGAEKHEKDLTENTTNARGDRQLTWLLGFDVLVKMITAVSAIRYCQGLIQTNALYMDSHYLLIMGYGVIIHGLLGLRVMACQLNAKNPDELNMHEFLYKRITQYFAFWRQRRFGSLATHEVFDYLLIAVIAMPLAYVMPYSSIWPLFHLMVSVSCTGQFFRPIIQDLTKLTSTLYAVLVEKRFWDGQAYVPLRSRLDGLRRCLKIFSLLDVLRAGIGYAIIHYTGIRPLGIIWALSLPLSIATGTLLNAQAIWGIVSLLFPFFIAPAILSLLIVCDARYLERDPSGEEVEQPGYLFKALCRAHEIPLGSEQAEKIETIYNRFMGSLVSMLILYTMCPVWPIGLAPLNSLAAGLVPVFQPTLTLANQLFVLMIYKTSLDINAVRIADYLRERGNPNWLCKAIENSIGTAWVIASLCSQVSLVSPSAAHTIASVATRISYYSGLGYFTSWLSYIARITGFRDLLSSIYRMIPHWLIFVPLRWGLDTITALTVNKVAIFGTATVMTAVISELYDKLMQINFWAPIERRGQTIDMAAKIIFYAAYATLLVSVSFHVWQFALALSAGMTWKALFSAYAWHLASIAFVGMIIYALTWLDMEYLRNHPDLAQYRKKTTAEPAGNDPDSAPRPASSLGSDQRGARSSRESAQNEEENYEGQVTSDVFTQKSPSVPPFEFDGYESVPTSDW